MMVGSIRESGNPVYGDAVWSWNRGPMLGITRLWGNRSLIVGTFVLFDRSLPLLRMGLWKMGGGQMGYAVFL